MRATTATTIATTRINNIANSSKENDYNSIAPQPTDPHKSIYANKSNNNSGIEDRDNTYKDINHIIHKQQHHRQQEQQPDDDNSNYLGNVSLRQN